MNDQEDPIRLIRQRAEQLPIPIPAPSGAMAKGRQRRRVSIMVTTVATCVIAIGVALPLRALMRIGEDDSTPIGPVSTTSERIFLTSVHLPDDPGRIYSMAPDGSDLTRVTHGPGSYSSASISPDGSRLAYVLLDEGGNEGPGPEGIYVSNVDGSDATEVFRSTNTPQSLVQLQWSPDGQTLAFILLTIPEGGGSEADWSYRLWVMGADGSEPHPVSVEQITSFSWSPAGDRFAVTQEGLDGDRFVDDIFLMPLDGSRMTRLTSEGSSRDPIWSPNGQHIAFTEGWASDGPQTMVMTPDGSDIRRLPIEHEGWTEPLAWNPDSTHLLVSAGSEENQCSGLLVSLAGEASQLLQGTTGLTVSSPEETPSAGGDPCVQSASWFAGTPELVESSATGTAPASAEYLPLVFPVFGNGWHVRNFDSVEEGTATKAWAATVAIDARDLGPRKPAIPVHTIESLPPGEAVIVALATPWSHDPDEGPYRPGRLDPLRLSDATIRGPVAEEPEGDYTIYDIQNRGHTTARVFFRGTPTGAELEGAQAQLATLEVPPTCPVGYETTASPVDAAPGETVTLTGPMPFQRQDGSFDVKGRTIAIAWWNADQRDWGYLSSFSTDSPSPVASGPIVRLGEGGVGQCSFSITFTVPDVPPGDYPIVIIHEGPLPSPNGSALSASLSVRVR